MARSRLDALTNDERIVASVIECMLCITFSVIPGVESVGVIVGRETAHRVITQTTELPRAGDEYADDLQTPARATKRDVCEHSPILRA